MNNETRSRKSLLDNLLKPLKDEYQQIINENLPSDGNLSNLDSSTKNKLIQLRNKIKLYREELVILNRRLMTKKEKQEERINAINLMKKFFDESNNDIKADYGELYIDVLKHLELVKEKEILLSSIYEFLDEKTFRYTIPDDYLNVLEKQKEISSVIRKMKMLSNKIN